MAGGALHVLRSALAHFPCKLRLKKIFHRPRGAGALTAPPGYAYVGRIRSAAALLRIRVRARIGSHASGSVLARINESEGSLGGAVTVKLALRRRLSGQQSCASRASKRAVLQQTVCGGSCSVRERFHGYPRLFRARLLTTPARN